MNTTQKVKLSSMNQSFFNGETKKPTAKIYPNTTQHINSTNSTNTSDPTPDGTEMPSEYYVPFVLLGVLSFFIVLANSLVIFMVYKNKQLRTITNLCLACLALSDLLSGFVAIPLIFACNFVPFPEGIPACIAMDLASRFIAFSTILHLLVVTFERYIMIIYPMHYHSIISKWKTAATLIVIWCFSLSASLIQLLWISLDFAGSESEQRSDAIYSYSCFGAIVALPLILLAAAYIRIFLVLRTQLKRIRRHLTQIRGTRRIKQKRGQRRAMSIFGSMIFAFILGWFSYFLSAMLHDQEVEILLPPVVNIILLFMRFGTSLVNPLLYTFFKEDFKKVFKSYLVKNPRIIFDEIPLNSNNNNVASTTRSE